MRITKLRKQIPVSLALIALSILAVPAVKAQCGASARKGTALAPELKSLQEPAAQNEEDLSDRAGSPEALTEEKNDSIVSILGFWKEIYYSGGVLNDVGFGQFSAGGTELLNDVGAFNAGNNFCMGAWKKVGPRSYDIVHTFFVFDGTNAIGVSIEKAHIVLSRDGKRVNGTWTQDNLTSPGVSPRGFILMVRQREPELLPDSNTRFRCRSEAVYEGHATLSEVEARQRHAPRGNISTV
jgi:hypothetical protein